MGVHAGAQGPRGGGTKRWRNERKKLGWIIFVVPDVPETVAFYEAAFGLGQRFVTEDGSYGEMETGAS
ncbi:MAG TPA: hypothetical protein VER37_05345, partial [Thermomicrobiales bacterium]|nr:hypothetical protein [Thermomicrobiales bacterium]